MLLGWVFLVLEQIGESCENPFEGSANDVPISQISRMIEIDLRDMLNENDLPQAIQPTNGILM
jgi:putative membrane protein